MNNPVPPSTAAVSKGPYLSLLMLTGVYAFNYVDRQIISILKEPIASELSLSDTQLGLLGGLAFAVVYTTCAIPVAWLADRISRRLIIALALSIWSGFTAVCGLTSSFAQLFLARMGVGVGEAGGVAPAYSLIADLFPGKMRATALSIFSFGIPLGSATGILFGGLLAAHVDWRFAFLTVGLAGVLFAPLVYLLTREPRESLPNSTTSNVKKPDSRAAIRAVCRKPSFWLISCGAGFSSMMGYGFMYWTPTFLARSLELDLSTRSWVLAGILFIGGVAGSAIGGVLADRLGAKSKRAFSLIPAFAFVLAIPAYMLALNARSAWEAFAFFLVPQALSFIWFGPVLTTVQHLGPPASRSLVSSFFLLINGLIGISFGPLFFGMVSDALKPRFGDQSIQYAFLSGLVFFALAAALHYAASRRIERDWVPDTSAD